jgi:alkaline phosphatase D
MFFPTHFHHIKKADLTFLCTGRQVLLDRESGSETWENYPSEMQRLFDMVKVSGKEHLVLVTGDQHYGEVNRLDNAFGYDAVEIQFSGINQRESPEFNSYRVSPVADSRHSMALIDIQWKDTDEEPAHILYRVYDTFNQKLEFTYRINFSELKN